MSSPSSGAAHRGLVTQHRLVLLACVVDAGLAVPHCYHRSAPGWAAVPCDRIYSVAAAVVHCRMQLLQQAIDMLDQIDEANLCRPTVAKIVGVPWYVEYPTSHLMPLVPTRGPGRRMHPAHTMTGRNAFLDAERVRDFEGRVLVSRCFAMFPGV